MFANRDARRLNIGCAVENDSPKTACCATGSLFLPQFHVLDHPRRKRRLTFRMSSKQSKQLADSFRHRFGETRLIEALQLSRQLRVESQEGEQRRRIGWSLHEHCSVSRRLLLDPLIHCEAFSAARIGEGAAPSPTGVGRPQSCIQQFSAAKCSQEQPKLNIGLSWVLAKAERCARKSVNCEGRRCGGMSDWRRDHSGRAI